jgi:hypothetical protein
MILIVEVPVERLNLLLADDYVTTKKALKSTKINKLK